MILQKMHAAAMISLLPRAMLGAFGGEEVERVPVGNSDTSAYDVALVASTIRWSDSMEKPL